jgi:beta-glucosidase
VTFERRWEDSPVYDTSYPPEGSNRVTYSEGIFVGYRGYERSGAKPLFPFGYGLSYTIFRYRNLSIQRATASASQEAAGGSPPLYEVSSDVTNTGSRAGTDVSEPYVGEDHPVVPRPTKELKVLRVSTCSPDKRSASKYCRIAEPSPISM